MIPRCQAIEQLADEFPVAECCRVLNAPRATYYFHATKPETKSQVQDQIMAKNIQDIFQQHQRRYGARRIAKELKRKGITCDVKRVARLMKQLGLAALQPKSFQPKTTQSKHRLGYAPNLLINAKKPTAPNQILVGDISYLPLPNQRFVYLASLMDLFSRKVVAHHVDDHMREELVIETLRKAIRARQPKPGLIHHTDRGGQYAGNAYRAMLKRAGIKQSMSEAGSCYDNAHMESCFGTIKGELAEKMHPDLNTWSKEIQKYIRYYNQQRIHSGIDYQTPDEKERDSTTTL